MILRRRHKTVVKPKKKKSRFSDVAWDYIQPKDTRFSGTQRDWNQTLTTKINQCSAQIHKASMCGGADVIECGTNLETIFNDLDYYHSKKKQFGGRYSVVFKDELQNRVKVYNRKRPDLVYYVNVRGIKAFDYIPERKINNRSLLLTR